MIRSIPVTLLVSTSAALVAGCGGLASPAETPSTPVAETPTPSTQAGTDPYAVATEAVADFCDPDNPEWFDNLSANLSPRGVEVYETVDPANVQSCEVDGAVDEGPPAEDRRHFVRVDSDMGQWGVTLTREEYGPWGVDQFTFPPEDGGDQPAHTDTSEPDI